MLEKVQVELEGVPETLLWTLYHRAAEARRPDAVLHDPLAVELVERIDYPFAQRFGRPWLAQWQAVRASCFDGAVRSFVAAHPGGTVVALGEGLETQFWRVDDGRVRWLAVDLPEVVAVRERLLPASPRRRDLARSALDERWMDEVDPSRGVLVTAQGLVMYLERAAAERLMIACARRFRGGALIFDAAPRWLSDLSRRGDVARGIPYRPPPWPWGIDRGLERRLARLDAAIVGLRALPFPRGRGVLHDLAFALPSRVAALRRRMLTIYELRFARPG